MKAAGTTLEVSTPKTLFEVPVDVVNPAGGNRYDVSTDGQRFLINAPVENTSSAPITVVVNWMAGLKQ